MGVLCIVILNLINLSFFSLKYIILFDYIGRMVDWRVIEGLLEYEYSNKSKEMIKKVLVIGVFMLMGILFIILLFIVVSFVYEK